MEPPSSLIDDYVSWWIILILAVFLSVAFECSLRPGFVKSVKDKADDRNANLNYLFASFFTVLSVIVVCTLGFRFMMYLHISDGALFAISILIGLITFALIKRVIPNAILKFFPAAGRFLIRISKLLSAPFFKPFSKILNYYSEEINENINETDEQLIEEIKEPEKRELVRGIIEFSEKETGEIMTKREDMVTLNLSMSNEEVFKIIADSGFSRFPVYKAEIDFISGFVHIKDLLSYLKKGKFEFDWKEFIRPIQETYSNTKINELMEDMRLKKSHMALVLYPNGSTAGIVTLEDILEEIVGEISDETDNI